MNRKSFLTKWFGLGPCKAAPSRRQRSQSARPQLESLEDRLAPAVTASFKPTGILVVRGDNLNNNILISRSNAGAILVNGKTVSSAGGIVKVAKVKQITVNALAGDDTVAMNLLKGALPRATVIGGAGADKVVILALGGDFSLGASSGLARLQRTSAVPFELNAAATETIDINALGGGADSATIDNLNGTGVAAVNLNLGGGADAVTVHGTAAADTIQAVAAGANVQVNGLGATVSLFQPSAAAGDTLTVNGLGGDDTMSAGVLSTLIGVTLNGGDGNDTINGGNGADTLLGGAGNDTIDGNQGNDTALMGAGNDTFVWDPGDGSDIVEGDADQDTLRFNGNAGAEQFTAQRQGGRLEFLRVQGNIDMDVDNVEILALNALGGADSITINDLTGTDVTTVNIDLGVSGAGDGGADTVTVNATAAADVVQAISVATDVQVNGLTAQINITKQEAANDRVILSGLGGNDTLSGGALATLMQLTLDGGDDNDTINGGNGADFLLGGDGNDTIDGNQGNDTAFMGAGNDTFVWDPGDGSDVVEGQDGLDTLRFNGNAGAEQFTAQSQGGRLEFLRVQGTIDMDCDDVETLTLNALGGIDTITVNDLAATDIGTVNISLGVAGAGDTAADAVIVNGAPGVDVMSLSGSGGSVTLTSAAVVVAITNAEPANDTLTINTLGGDDIVSASDLANDSVVLTLNGGNDDDILVGSQGNDTINGDAGNDLLAGDAGTDTGNGGAGTDLNGGGLETFNQ